ncbi:hypothetical protein DAPPUDRAFT_93965 [Daphnia pulex]|uniref:Uncharacterized protein n=1 Tax=Daphnia pulex TaxID=6669 RepID=E9FRS0_DAPPU|nr:hypothetical protein DAPPUDRAFT_93965 [Daphnia pulex]|eukprot:EFX90435.1 hypothetical protein DAPPUDRAFT_93965 [Daphnia pulex]
MKMERSESSRAAGYPPKSSLVYGGPVLNPLATFLASSSLPSVSLPTSVRSSCQQANRCKGSQQQRPSLFDILSPPAVVMAAQTCSSNDRSVTASVRLILTKRIDQVRSAATRNSTA